MKNDKGFSLVELMVTIVVFGILAVMAFPNLSMWVKNSRLKASARELHQICTTAKLSALRDGHRTIVTVTKKSATITQVLDNGSIKTLRTISPEYNTISYSESSVTFRSSGTPTAATNLSVTDGREIQVQIGAGGAIRIVPISL